MPQRSAAGQNARRHLAASDTRDNCITRPLYAKPGDSARKGPVGAPPTFPPSLVRCYFSAIPLTTTMRYSLTSTLPTISQNTSHAQGCPSRFATR